MGTLFRRAGEKKYSISWRDEHGRRRAKRSSRDRRVAQEELRQLEDRAERIRLGMPVAGQDERKAFGVALDAYEVQQIALGRCSTAVAENVSRLRRMGAACGWVACQDITAASLAGWLAAQAPRLAPTTRNIYRATARAFCAWLVGQDWLPANPVVRVARANVGQPGDTTHRPRARRAFSLDEFERLSAVDGTGHRGIDLKRRYLYRVAGLSGLRISELRALTREDFSLGSCPMWHLRPAITKAKRLDRVPMLPECVELMACLSVGKAATERIFTYCNDETFAVDLERAKIPKRDHTGRQVDFHSLRRTFCTFAARVLPIQVVSKLLRHSSIVMTTSIYLDLGLTDMAEMMQRLPPVLGKRSKTG